MGDLDIDEDYLAISHHERIYAITGDDEDMKIAQWLRERQDGTRHPDNLIEEED